MTGSWVVLTTLLCSGSNRALVLSTRGGSIPPTRSLRRPDRSRRRSPVIDRPRVGSIRLIDEEGNQVGIIEISEALAIGDEKGLDLVEIAPQAEPPTCKLMDYGKFMYDQKKKTQKQKKVIQKRKEIKLRPKTDENDFSVKLERARKFLGKGHKVLVTMVFRGRETIHLDRGRELLAKFALKLEDIAKVEQTPAREGRNRMNMVLGHK
jgi:translation initiation factor IF-3